MTGGGSWKLALPALAAALSAAGPALAQHSLDMLLESGPPENRVDLVMMGDGYTLEELGLFADDADEALEHLFAGAPYAEYRPLFNIARIDTVSAESGADHPSQDHWVDTFFGCAFDCAGLERLICCDSGAIFAAAAVTYPAYDVILLLVNDDEYGGSGGQVAITSVNVWAFDVPPHEFGHTFAGLGDEYEDPYPGFVFADIYPNVSPTADGDLLKWRYWVEEGTPLPTPDSAAVDDHHPVGAYEGACYQPTGLFRPAPDCLMRSLGKTLCPVCAEAMVLSFWASVEPIDSYEPQDPDLSAAAGDVLEFSVEPVRPEPDTMITAWLVDGEELLVTGQEQLALPVECLASGSHEVTVLVRDATPLVIADEEGLLSAGVSWTVTRADEGPAVECPDLFGADGDTDADTDSSPDSGPGGSGGDGCGCASIGARPGAGVDGLLSVLGLLQQHSGGGC